MSKKLEIAILGAGPCGLGAAWRLKELGFENFEIFEANDYAGGLATTFTDAQGFLWDIGGHVQFSHYEDFDRVMDAALGKNGWIHHERESWVWILNRFVPYPFQNNLWRLPADVIQDCVRGLEQVHNSSELSKPSNFKDWLEGSFGKGLCSLFMYPYNFKVWAHPPEAMSYQWIGERVAKVDLLRVKENVKNQKDEVAWGPNATFRFPREGGTGAIWRSVAEQIGENKIRLGKRAKRIDKQAKKIYFQDATSVQYEKLLSTIPLNKLCDLTEDKLSGSFKSSNSHIVGIGLKGEVPEELRTKCWMYFPESNCPFYRVTVFSNYSPNNVPDPNKFWSLMTETSESVHKPVDREKLVEETIQGLLNTKMISSRSQIVSRWYYTAEPGYPTPFMGRDGLISEALELQQPFEIYPRGRFGIWKYEVSNQDHTFMQGYEWANSVIRGSEEQTCFLPGVVNAPGKRKALG